ncbi:sugar phosphate isomerase/epimerase family protein [Aureibacillus halotolerans]|uniref:L-xylulose 5-phosphate 3-epimerase n=1 Tax=Aureibacillus halotolerans TaxID=1508390 RepID=A0A4R6U7T3_9BACI|nr:sugar phosphate isomerase/epimerase family protein [Aureibacillus halotolerans]TDQ42588.1 L-xylulose 5-phosphate 3-epimerase [Aureibacillus halotolerans]
MAAVLQLNNMKFGINASSLPAHVSFSDTVRLLKSYGYDGIELNLEEDEKAFLPETFSPGDLETLKRVAEESEVRISGISTTLLWNSTLSSNDEQERNLAKQRVRRMIDAAYELGSDTVLVVPGIVDETTSYDVVYDRSIEALQELGTYATSAGVTIGVENVPNRFLLSPLEWVSYIDHIGSENVGMYLDIGNVRQNGFPEQWIDVLEHRIVGVHVKDYTAAAGPTLPLLTGDIAWDRVAASLKWEKFSGWISVELPPTKLYPKLLLKHHVSAMQRIFE